MAKAKGLGRGLEALFGEEQQPEKQAVGIRLSEIEPNPRQPRRDFDPEALAELAESIRENGVITPITLRKTGDTYQIIAGERRWRAARMAGLHEVPAMVLDVDEDAAYALALIENLQREDLNPMEEAEGYRRLTQELGLTQEQAAQRVGISRPAVANALRLLALPEPVARLLRTSSFLPDTPAPCCRWRMRRGWSRPPDKSWRNSFLCARPKRWSSGCCVSPGMPNPDPGTFMLPNWSG